MKQPPKIATKGGDSLTCSDQYESCLPKIFRKQCGSNRTCDVDFVTQLQLPQWPSCRQRKRNATRWAPSPVINGVIAPYKIPINGLTLLRGVITPFTTGRGPSCKTGGHSASVKPTTAQPGVSLYFRLPFTWWNKNHGEVCWKGQVPYYYWSRDDSVDGRNPAPADVVDIPVFIRFYTSQILQDFQPSTVLGYTFCPSSWYLSKSHGCFVGDLLLPTRTNHGVEYLSIFVKSCVCMVNRSTYPPLTYPTQK